MATSRSRSETHSQGDELLRPSSNGTCEINGHALYWEKYGEADAPYLMLLHHGLGSIRSWRRQIPAFIDSGWQVLVQDRWGYGRSDRRPAFEHAYLISDAAETFELLDRLAVDRVGLVGHSDGGTIALLMGSEQPERFPAIVVVAAHIYFEPRMVAGLQLIADYADDPSMITGLEREHGDRATQLLQTWVGYWQSHDAQDLDMRDRLADITSPTLVIQGELDEHATPQHARDIAESVHQGDLWIVPGVKHMPPHEVPQEFNQRVLRFLAIALA